MLAELGYGAVEGLDGPVGAREHDAAFHDYKNVGGEGVEVGFGGKGGAHRFEAFPDGVDPAVKVHGDEGMRRGVFGVDLEGKTAEGAAVLAVGGEDTLAIAGEDGKDAVEGLLGGGEGGVDDHGAQEGQVAFEDLAEESLLAIEEVIEAAGVDLGVGQKLDHAGAGKATLPEEIPGGIDEAVAG